MRSKRFKDMSGPERLLACTLLFVGLIIVAAAQRDLGRRSEAEVSGSRLVWRILCLNALGALAYFRWGRRTAPA